jgi:Zn ribbon nucleic-acid-binding protein
VKTNLTNRMATKEKPEWESAKIVMRPPERVIVCPACGDPRHRVRLTRPERGITQRVCVKCGVKYAIRGEDTPSPQAQIIEPVASQQP